MDVLELEVKPLTKSRQSKHARLELVPVRSEVLTAAQFVEMARKSPSDIARSRFIPPKLGGRGFGRVEVEYTIPTLRLATES